MGMQFKSLANSRLTDRSLVLPTKLFMGPTKQTSVLLTAWANRITYRQTHRQTDGQTVTHTDRQTDRWTRCLVYWLSENELNRRRDRFVTQIVHYQFTRKASSTNSSLDLPLLLYFKKICQRHIEIFTYCFHQGRVCCVQHDRNMPQPR